MTPSARLSAAIDVFAQIADLRLPAAEALRDWGRKNRYAGAKDRVAIAGIVYDALRTRASSAWIMGDDSPRATVLGALSRARALGAQEIAALCSGERYAPAPLDAAEREKLETATLDGAPDHVAGDFPEWLAPYFTRAFGADAIIEGRALAERAPVDLRVNSLKSTRENALEELAHLDPQPTPFAPFGLRIAVRADGRGPALLAEPAYVKGLVEVQDESSQLVAALAQAQPGEQVLDLCAGGGGKTLAIAASMDNKGQIYATDSDGRRLMPIFERLERAGVRNAQVRAPRGQADILTDIEGRCDLVLVDAPCTGVGTWRRNPDAKWRMRPGALEQRMKDQDAALARASAYVRPGGRLAYVTCSLLREENEDRVAAFLAAHDDFFALDMADVARGAGLGGLLERATPAPHGMTLLPSRVGADGFFICVMRRR